MGDAMQFGQQEWRVLAEEDGKALLIRKDILEERRYCKGHDYANWENCELRQYLNSTYYNTFSEAERSRITQVTLANPHNLKYRTIDGGSSTADRVFLLSIEEVVKYFGSNWELLYNPANHHFDIDESYWLKDRNNDERAALFNRKSEAWWLRSPGEEPAAAAFVDRSGVVHINGRDKASPLGVRPALWLNLDG